MYGKALATMAIWVSASMICINVQDSFFDVMVGVVICTVMIWLIGGTEK